MVCLGPVGREKGTSHVVGGVARGNTCKSLGEGGEREYKGRPFAQQQWPWGVGGGGWDSRDQNNGSNGPTPFCPANTRIPT